MMGFADFPVEILRALKTKPADNKAAPESSCDRLRLLSQFSKNTDWVLLDCSTIGWRENKVCQFVESITQLFDNTRRESRRLDRSYKSAKT